MKEKATFFLSMICALLVMWGLADLYGKKFPQPEILPEIPIEYLLENPELHLGDRILARGKCQKIGDGEYILTSLDPNSSASINCQSALSLPDGVEIVAQGFWKQAKGKHSLEVISFSILERV